MSGPRLADVRALAGEEVRVVVPKPREDQRLVGTVAVEGECVRLRIDDESVGIGRFGTIEFRARAGDGVVRAFRDDGTLIGRVRSVTRLDET